MSKQIQAQAAKLWQIVKDPATSATYTQTAATTWSILKETGYLLWLVICLVLVLGDWIWRTGYRTGWSTREWFNNFEKPDTDRVAQDAGQSLLQASKTAVANAISTAKEQLGIEDTAEPLLASASTPSTPSASASTPSTPPPPATPKPSEPAPTTLTPSAPPPIKTEDLDSE